ncbi:PDZ and LIM domain protein 4 isoform X1 [Uranotaenia lowii]|uniref:PDZ and LIM domain protein 4 isoform X1 n=1 Tax=Uranotaenia lowii TaxID=190385 RepID=UPI002478716B|nr:PDZ and LIM domain protein 4 isoform X1 [Uranotaenia lowii]
MSPKPHEFLVTLQRRSPQIPWGIRLVGGTDLNAPLIITRVQVNSPAQKELLRGDIITKIDQYDARDLTHNDAQNLFRNAGGEIKVTIRRDDKVAMHQSARDAPNGVASFSSPPALSPIPPAHAAQPYKPYVDQSLPAPSVLPQKPQQHQNFPPPDPTSLLPRVSSPLPHGPQAYATALEHPVETLPHTVFPKLDASGAYQLPKTPYPPMIPTSYEDGNEAALANQPYRTTPLVLPGAKVPKKDALPTESYLRHHPNPAMRAAPHDIIDTLMKQKVAETVLHRVIGEEPPTGPKIVHKQFNSPIGLYSDSNIENTIRQATPLSHQPQQQPQQQFQTQAVPSNGFTSRHRPTKIEGYKKTVVFDPSKSETYRFLQEGSGEGLQEVATPIQPRTFHANRLIPGKKPNANHPAPQPEFVHPVNSMGVPNENIHQSGSFKRLMHHVLADAEY